MKRRTWLMLLMGIGLLLACMAADDIDWNRARALLQRQTHGEALSAEDQAYLDRAKTEFQRRNEATQASTRISAPPASRPALPLVPLNQLPAGASYKGEDGGLYGGGQNVPPPEHLKAALAMAGKITPLDRLGKPSPSGKIVLMSLGMSNTMMEFATFMQAAHTDAAKSPQVLLVDGAQGGRDAEQWVMNDNGQPRSNSWEIADTRLRDAGVTPAQVQVVWIKQAIASPARLGAYPGHANVLAGDLKKIIRIAQQRYANLRVAYLSSRIYGGYATTALNPEPYAYESAFSVRRVILWQIHGDAELNYNPQKGPVVAPLLLWGPYLWADGASGRAADDLNWLNTDFILDGTHPNPIGRNKVAELLLRFFKTDPTAKPWFCGPIGG